MVDEPTHELVNYNWACASGVCVELGSGEDSYAKLEDGDPIEMIAGVQGGYHIVAGFRVLDISPGSAEAALGDQPTVDFNMYLRGTQVDSAPPQRTHLEAVDETMLRFELVGHHVMFETDAVHPIAQHHGAPLRLEVTVTDVTGMRRVDAVDLVVTVRMQ